MVDVSMKIDASRAQLAKVELIWGLKHQSQNILKGRFLRRLNQISISDTSVCHNCICMVPLTPPKQSVAKAMLGQLLWYRQ